MTRPHPMLAVALALVWPWAATAQSPGPEASAPAFDEVQATIRRMQEKLDRLGSVATERDQALQFLQQQVEQATGEIAGSGKTYDALRGEAATLADKVQDLSADRDKLQGEVGARGETVASLETQLSTLVDDLASKAAEADALRRRMVELEADVGKGSALAAERGREIDRLNTDLAAARATTEEESHKAATEVASLKTQLGALADSLLAASGLEVTLRDKIAAMEAAAGKSHEELATKAAETEALQRRVAGLEADVGKSSTLAADRATEIDRLNTDVTAARAAAEEERHKAATEVASLKTRLGALADSLLAVSGREATLQAKVAAMEAAAGKSHEELATKAAEAERLGRDLAAAQTAAEDAKRKAAIEMAAARGAAEALRRQVESLGQEAGELNDQLAAAETTVDEQREQIDGLDSRLSEALAQRVEELEQYRSEFFGQLKHALGDRPDLRVVGDRFVFQSELLFASGSARLDPEGQAELRALAQTLQDVAGRIPPQLDWVLRVDGHTDKQPIRDSTFHSNWELSTARAISVIQFLVAQGIPPEHLAAAGFGEYRPIDPADDEIAYRRNRRIEFKLTEG